MFFNIFIIIFGTEWYGVQLSNNKINMQIPQHRWGKTWSPALGNHLSLGPEDQVDIVIWITPNIAFYTYRYSNEYEISLNIWDQIHFYGEYPPAY
jgi:hypothetical protein